MQHKLRVGQRWGAWLVMAGAAPRNNWALLQQIADRAHFRLEWAQVPDTAVAVVRRAADAWRRLQHPPSPLTRQPEPTAPHGNDNCLCNMGCWRRATHRIHGWRYCSEWCCNNAPSPHACQLRMVVVVVVVVMVVVVVGAAL